MVSRFDTQFPAPPVFSMSRQAWHLSGDLAESSTDGDEDLFTFLDEEPEDEQTPLDTKAPWVLLVVDDEQQVHEATVLTLRRARIANRPFRFLHASSAAEARQIISAEPQIDLVLLDVVMETRDAGFKLVTELRGPMGRKDLKILIRSGQPGLESESTVCKRYPVDGYMQKSQQTYALMMDVIGNLLLGTSPDRHSAC
ncbi:MAG: response regulator [Proteobacteria bacterium]|nr:response regulator [Pseudomonadota bacterium]